MATPHRSRYSRPLKATLPYANSIGCSTTKGMPTSGTAAGSPTGGSRRGSGERRTSPERKSPVTAVTGKDDEANAKGSFNDPDCYMNSLWPRVPSSQFEVESPVHIEGDVGHFYHRRSNSCSGSDNNTALHKVHTCKSIEGLNQEISAVLDGKDLGLMLQHPDGHIAPVTDLLASTVGTPVETPNQSMCSGPSSPAASPYWPHTASCHAHHEEPLPHPHGLLVQDGGISGQVGEGYQTSQAGDGFSSDGILPTNHTHSPKPSFVAREPPDGAERCSIKQESRVLATDVILGGPDKSKGNIVFRGSAFAPLLSSSAIKVPINNTACT